jgi:DNA polymerase III subunit delta'
MDIIGHEKQKEILFKLGENGNIPHALLFSGGDKIGKKKMAIEFAKKLLGEDDSTDFFLLLPEDGIIKIEEVRNLQEKLSLKPYNHSFKIGIIDDAHLMRKDAQNAFLKTLEEPRGNSILILITPYPYMLLGTILSRVQEIKFSLVPKQSIEKHLIKLGAKPDKAKEISLISSGQIGKAIDYFNNPDKVEMFNQAIKDISGMERTNYFQRFNFAKKMSELENIDEIMDIWQRYFRREMILRVNNNEDVYRAKELIKNIDKTRYLINSTNANKRLIIESLLLKI